MHLVTGSCDLLLLQVYPTAIRAFGMALCSMMSRLGGMSAPFIAQVTMMYVCAGFSAQEFLSGGLKLT